MWNDLRVAARQLAKHRTFTLAAVAALAIGMSVTTTMFTIIHGVYFRDLPFVNPERIVAIATRYVDRGPRAIDNWSVPDLRDVQASARLFESIVAADEESMDLADEEFAPERFTGAWVSPSVFAMTGYPPPADEVPSASVAVVNEQFASLRFAGAEVVGRVIRLEPASPDGRANALTIVDVVPNVRQASPRQPGIDLRSAEPVIYLTYAANPLPSAAIVVRTSVGAAAVAGALRDVFRVIDPDLPLAGSVVPLDEAIDQELGLLTVFASMIGLFALAAMSLAMIGVYGVTAYAVAKRTRELGLRLALGASAWHVWWVVTRRAALQLLTGLGLGLGGALSVGTLLQGLTSGVSSRDPATLIAVTGLMTVAACLACLVPAARAIRLDPVVVLRVE